MNIVIPMAGHGSRFSKAGYKLPKPLIDVNGKPMIGVVVNNIRPSCEHRFIFICRREHLDKYNLTNYLNQIAPDCIILTVPEVTEGAACTVLVAKEYINNNDQLMIANSDQFVDININDYLKKITNKDGLVMTMKATDPKWSFIRTDSNGDIAEIREKEVISSEATVGIYNYSKGKDFVKYAEKMIELNIRVNNEFYVAPVYNLFINDGAKIAYYNVGEVDKGMYGLGVPDDLNRFLSSPISKKI
jgi:dTDP-glucose pyrophosphorylase